MARTLVSKLTSKINNHHSLIINSLRILLGLRLASLDLESKIEALRDDWKNPRTGWKRDDSSKAHYDSLLLVDTSRVDGNASIEVYLSSEGKGNRVSLVRISAWCTDYEVDSFAKRLIPVEGPTMRRYEELVSSIFKILGIERPLDLSQLNLENDLFKITYEKNKVNTFGGYVIHIEVIPKMEIEEAEIPPEDVSPQKTPNDSRGEKPKRSAWDGSIACVKDYMRNILNDPSSVEYHKWWGLVATTHKDTPCWGVKFDYSARNAFGGMVRNVGFAYIKNEKIIGYSSQ